jgi:dTDP-4-dehydrorhamnose 3,5-epimerase-like enzyme
MPNSKPYIIKGEIFTDHRGDLFSCNNFDMSMVKRMYIIDNIDNSYVRGWKGHKIETRWFFASKGSVTINTISISNLENKNLSLINSFILSEGNLDILKVPPGFATSIKQYSNGDKICVFADFKLGVTDDEYLRWNL